MYLRDIRTLQLLLLLLGPPRVRSRGMITRAILDPSKLEQPLVRRSPERSPRDNGDGGQDHCHRYRTTT